MTPSTSATRQSGHNATSLSLEPLTDSIRELFLELSSTESETPRCTPSLSTLPPELVHQIIESTVPHTFHSTTYKQRSGTLRSVSLVSKLFYSIAQPLLLEMVWINIYSARYVMLEQAKRALARTLIILDANNFVPQYLIPGANIRSLTLVFTMLVPVPLDPISNCRNLADLQLAGSAFFLKRSNSFPSIRTLSITFQAAHAVHQLVNAEALPSLTALGLKGSYDPSVQSPGGVPDFASLLPQLDMLVAPYSFYTARGIDHHPNLASKTLVDIHLNHLGRNPANLQTLHHIDYAPKSSRYIDRFIHYKRLKDFVFKSQSSRNLESIYAEPVMVGDPVIYEYVCSQLRYLEDQCRKRGIVLIWGRHISHIDCDPIIPEKFWERQRMKKRLEVTKGEGK